MEDDMDDEQMLRHGMKKHKKTTEHAQNASRIAAEIQDSAKATLVDLNRQGEQMKRTQAKFDELEHDVDRAESLLSWLGRCCWCCNCCRADEPSHWTKKHYTPSNEAAANQQKQASKLQAAQEAERKEKMNARANGKKHVIGNGLGGQEGENIRDETRTQDDYLENVDLALDDIKKMSTQMQMEIGKQTKQAEDFQGNADHVHDRIGNLKRHGVLRKHG